MNTKIIPPTLEFRKRLKTNTRDLNKWANVLLAQQNLGWAKYFGKIHVDNMRLLSTWGVSFSETDLQRVLAYNEIRDLDKSDVNTGNVDEVKKAIEWAQWIPKIDQPVNKKFPDFYDKMYYKCSQCRGVVPAYTATYPDRSRASSFTIHKEKCLGRF